MPPAADEMLLLRHAPADHDGRLCGRTDVPARPLDAAMLAPLRQLLAGCTRAATSPARRCRDTAAALLPAAVADPRLWEQDFGAHDGLPFAEIPDLGVRSRAELAAHVPPGGESFAAMARRVTPALRELAGHARQGGPVAVVAHAGTVRAALGLALGDVAAGLAFEVAPLSVTRLRCLEDGFAIVAANCRAA